MTKAVLKNGVICPVGPLPADWTEGTELRVERAPALADPSNRSRSDEWMDAVEAAVADNDGEDDERLQSAIDHQRAQAKEWAKRQAESR